jgi:hypothetical protein
MQTLKEPENLQLTFPDGTVLSSGDLVLVTLEFAWLPVPCKILEILVLQYLLCQISPKALLGKDCYKFTDFF